MGLLDGQQVLVIQSADTTQRTVTKRFETGWWIEGEESENLRPAHH